MTPSPLLFASSSNGLKTRSAAGDEDENDGDENDGDENDGDEADPLLE